MRGGDVIERASAMTDTDTGLLGGVTVAVLGAALLLSDIATAPWWLGLSLLVSGAWIARRDARSSWPLRPVIAGITVSVVLAGCSISESSSASSTPSSAEPLTQSTVAPAATTSLPPSTTVQEEIEKLDDDSSGGSVEVSIPEEFQAWFDVDRIDGAPQPTEVPSGFILIDFDRDNDTAAFVFDGEWFVVADDMAMSGVFDLGAVETFISQFGADHVVYEGVNPRITRSVPTIQVDAWQQPFPLADLRTALTIGDPFVLATEPSEEGLGGTLGSGCSPGSDVLPDGVWFGSIAEFTTSGVLFDLKCATYVDGGGYDELVITNSNPKLRTVPVAQGAAVSDNRGGAGLQLVEPFGSFSQRYFELEPSYQNVWIEITDGQLTRLEVPFSS